MKVFELSGPISYGQYDQMEVSGVSVWNVLNDLGHFFNSTGKNVRISLMLEEDGPKEAGNELG